jgi:hypothetical protein
VSNDDKTRPQRVYPLRHSEKERAMKVYEVPYEVSGIMRNHNEFLIETAAERAPEMAAVCMAQHNTNVRTATGVDPHHEEV